MTLTELQDGVRQFIREKLRRDPPSDVAVPHVPHSSILLQRVGHMAEELGELTRAGVNQDVVGLADGLADLVYIAFGTASDAGIDLAAVLEEVQKSNMTKSPLDADGKGGKGPGFVPPDVAGVLARKQRFVEESKLVESWNARHRV